MPTSSKQQSNVFICSCPPSGQSADRRAPFAAGLGFVQHGTLFEPHIVLERLQFLQQVARLDFGLLEPLRTLARILAGAFAASPRPGPPIPRVPWRPRPAPRCRPSDRLRARPSERPAALSSASLERLPRSCSASAAFRSARSSRQAQHRPSASSNRMVGVPLTACRSPFAGFAPAAAPEIPGSDSCPGSWPEIARRLPSPASPGAAYPE